MNESIRLLQSLPLLASTPREDALTLVRTALEHELGYHFSDVDEARPWGAYYRMRNDEADRFMAEFFPGVDPLEARLGNTDLELSPKILVILPGQRFSWQYHTYRAERWHFLTTASYYRSKDDVPGEKHRAEIGDTVQFESFERHRAEADADTYALIAEFWQHTDPTHPSEESDVIRLADDYKR